MIKPKGRLRGQMRDRRVLLSELMSIPQVMAESGLSRTTVYYHTASGGLPTYQVGNVLLTTRDEFTTWLARLRSDSRAAPTTR